LAIEGMRGGGGWPARRGRRWAFVALGAGGFRPPTDLASHHAALLEGDPRLRGVAGDDVVENLESQERTRGCEASRESEVLGRGRGVTRRVVVGQDQPAGEL
jgi:hypothetical protein